MKKALALFHICIFIACHSAKRNESEQFRSDLLKEIKHIETELSKLPPDKPMTDNSMTEKLTGLYDQFADSFPNDTLSPEMLFRSARLNIGVSRFQKAVKVLQRLHNAYPVYKKSPEALFLIGFVYDEYLSYKAKAREWYEKLIEMYPDHPFADDAKAAIKTLNMSDEEIINMLKEQNAAFDSTFQDTLENMATN